MSTIIVKSKKEIAEYLDPHKEFIRDNLREVTAKIFGTKPESIIVDFETWGKPSPSQAPDVLFRAETSIARRQFLRQWGESILLAWKGLVNSQNISLPPNIRVAVKSYVIDSEWIEDKSF